MIDNQEIWWPDELFDQPETVVHGDGKRHTRMNETQAPDDHLYTLKQDRTRVIWACACGQTLSRIKP